MCIVADMSSGHVLLGILAAGPAHGYDLKREHDARLPGAKPLAYGQVYATLARLQRDGLVEVATTENDGGPERTVYDISPAGEESLLEWLATPEPPGPYAAEELVRKTVTALRLHRDARPFLGAQRALHLDRMRGLVAEQRAAVDVDARIALDHTIFHLDADLRWLEAAAARVNEEGTLLR
ncbi:MAG: hypothetical protein JWR90_3322 [Marmoricola sp.]|jgi:DNA-binding PadR family transcriptional regulator|nr:hypothetical protein [Marmoricola sp.]